MKAVVRALASLAGAAVLGSAVPAFANCADEIAKLEKSLDNQDANAIASNSGGQKDAAARGGATQMAKKTGTPVEDLSHPGTGGDVGDTKAAAAAGAGGENVMDAKVTLNDAKNAKAKGDEKACMDAVNKAKSQRGR